MAIAAMGQTATPAMKMLQPPRNAVSAGMGNAPAPKMTPPAPTIAAMTAPAPRNMVQQKPAGMASAVSVTALRVTVVMHTIIILFLLPVFLFRILLSRPAH